jgi:hypothetical protein
MRIGALTCFLSLISVSSHAVGGDWPFVVPEAGDPFEHPPMRALALSNTKPDDVKEMVTYRGARQRYAQLRYGSPGSIRITIVLDGVSPGDVDLYVDANRNRRIEAKDKITGVERTWRLPLDVAVVEGEMTRFIPRAAIFRLGASGLTFSFAAAGYLEGIVSIGGAKHVTRRTDGDGNGFLTDPQDRLWIDLNDDGRWDPVAEQFLYSTILTLGESRHALRSDELGTRLALETVEGTGTVRLDLKRPAASPRATELHATLIGRDGSAVGLSGEGESTTVPAGEYRLGKLTFAFDDPAGGPKWSFIFSDDGGTREFKWYRVAKDCTLEIDPVGQLVLETGVDETSQSVAAGSDVSLQPRLFTGDGLLINACFRGSPVEPGSHEGHGVDVKLTGAADQSLGVACSGFA